MASMDARRRTLDVAGLRVPVFTWNAGGARTLVFLHGFARSPLDYGDWLARMAAAEDLRIVAPFLYANASLEAPPESFRACVALTRRTLAALALEGGVRDAPAIVGHSTGGAVALAMGTARPAPRALVAVNPLLPVRYGPAGFIGRGLRIAARQLAGRTGPLLAAWRHHLASGGPYLANLLRRPASTWRLMRDLAAFQLPAWRLLADATGARGRRLGVPAHVLLAPDDEFFREPPELGAWLAVTHRRVVLERVAARGHEWPMLRAGLAAEHTLAALDAASRAPADEAHPRPLGVAGAARPAANPPVLLHARPAPCRPGDPDRR
jgi:pimeloyl-ACP methyl ester carboxylesterase